MRSKRNPLLTTSIVVLYGAAVIGFALSLLLEYRAGPERAKARLAELEQETRQNLQVNDLGSEAFSSAFLRSIGNVSDIAGIQLIYDGMTLISYPTPEIVRNRSDSYEHSALITTNGTKLYAKDGTPVTLSTAIYLLRPSSIYQKGRIAFLVALIATVMSICYLIYLYAVPADDEAEIKDREDEIDDFLLETDEPTGPQGRTWTDPLYPAESAPSREASVPPQAQETVQDDADLPLPWEEPGESPEAWNAPPTDGDGADGIPAEPVQDDVPQAAEPQEDALDEPDFIPEIEPFEPAATKPVPPAERAAPEEAARTTQAPAHADEADFIPPVLNATITQEEFQALTKDFLPDEPQEAEELAEPEEPAPLEEPAERAMDDIAVDFPPETAAGEPELPARPQGQDAAQPGEWPQNPVNLPLSAAQGTPEPPLADEPQEEPAAPHGLFSPATGFGWEAYMLPRLDSELVRAASAEQDVSLCMIRIPQLDWTSEAGKDISSLISERMKFTDLIFEYKADGCTAILQGTDIDGALSQAEALHTDIIARLAKHSLYNAVCMGISSRSLRLISGSRLANEAEQALLHALEDKDSPIIAFKVNPEKYRNYLAAEAAKLESTGQS